MPAIRVSFAGKLSLLAFSLGIASAQIMPPVGYPGGYPGGGYPTGGGIPIPVPSRGKTQPNSSTKGDPLPNFRGKLKRMDAKSITLTLGDDRVLDFRRTKDTKFYKGGNETKDPKFNPGDQLSIEGPEDNTGYLTAVNVYWEKAGDAGGASTTTAAKDDKVPDTWADTPAAAPRATQAAQPAKPDANDPGPPTLKRGGAADNGREKSDPLPPIPPNGPPPAQPTLTSSNAASSNSGAPTRIPTVAKDEDDRYSSLGSTIPVTRGDDLIRRAADTALDFTEKLPNYVCQEMMSRYESETKPVSWHALDVVGMEVVYLEGKEDYRKLTLNGRPVNKKIEELGGAWSTGEFGTILIDLFAPQTAADFRYTRDSRMAGILTKEYDFSVTHANSHWLIHMGSQEYSPAYKGTVWIDPATARVMRIEMQAFGFPPDFASDEVESATDYEYVRLGDAKQYLLPVHAETLSCQRGAPYCSRNAIDFRNYKKYTGESSITFDK